MSLPVTVGESRMVSCHGGWEFLTVYRDMPNKSCLVIISSSKLNLLLVFDTATSQDKTPLVFDTASVSYVSLQSLHRPFCSHGTLKDTQMLRILMLTMFPYVWSLTGGLRCFNHVACSALIKMFCWVGVGWLAAVKDKHCAGRASSMQHSPHWLKCLLSVGWLICSRKSNPEPFHGTVDKPRQDCLVNPQSESQPWWGPWVD